jgi:hypothetical protein
MCVMNINVGINMYIGKLCESKLFLVDLAGSERLKKSLAVGSRY